MEIKSANRELTITRNFNAPRQLVWAAWTDADLLKEWFGPKGFTNPVCEWVTEVGKRIYIEMKAPDGLHYPMDGEFIEILPQEKMVFTCGALDNDGKRLFDIMNTITFVEEGDKTKLILQFTISNIKPSGLHNIDGMEMGWNMSLDKLVTLLNNLE